MSPPTGETDLFGDAHGARAVVPLAERVRPRSLQEVTGQDAILGPGGALGRMVAAGRLSSLILWGPPGVGKTTIARLLAEAVDAPLTAISAIFSGVKELRSVFDAAAAQSQSRKPRQFILFVDEIHRFNKAQQDSFLPHLESGLITLIGATTENPSFELNAALLSRCQVVTLASLDDVALDALLVRAEAHEGRALPLTPAARAHVRAAAGGDGRFVLNLAEEIWRAADAQGDPEAETHTPQQGPQSARAFDVDAVAAMAQMRAAHYDKTGDGHYGLISALHKAVRASDPDAALYWLARMLAAGEDPRYLARRLIRMASEDIGAADPTALLVAQAGDAAWRSLGSPEGDLALAHVTVHLAMAPKSNAIYTAFKAARDLALKTGHLAPPAHVLNAPTALMKAQGFGAGYAYDHDAPGGVAGQSAFPDALGPHNFYAPTDRGREAAVRERLAQLRALRAARRAEDEGAPDDPA